MSPNLHSITARQFIKALQKDKFIKTRQSGSHAVYKKSEARIVIVAIHSRGETFPIGTVKKRKINLGGTNVLGT